MRFEREPILSKPLPRPFLVGIVAMGLIALLVSAYFLAEARERNRETQEVKWGWLTINSIVAYSIDNPGSWPSNWSDLKQDYSHKVKLDFTLRIEDLRDKPHLIYQAIRLKDHPELQGRMRTDLDDLRNFLLDSLSKSPPASSALPIQNGH